MTWSWRYEARDGSVLAPGDVPAVPAGSGFPSQGDAETWIGETWQELLDAGVWQVTLLDGQREVYGPMGLSPAAS